MAQSISQEAIGATGLPGATAASRHAGATTSGAPTTGTFAVGDYVVDQTGAMYVCTVAGTPGTWQLSGVSVNENIAGKNFVINGGMDIWQRGTSFSTSSGNIYTADRYCFTSGGNAATVSQVTSGAFNGTSTAVSSTTLTMSSATWNTNAYVGYTVTSGSSTATVTSNTATVLTFSAWTGGTPSTGSFSIVGQISFQYAHRVQRNSGTSGTAGMYLCQSLETKNSIPMAGQTVTWSFWARAGANYSQSGSTLYVQLVTGTGTDQNVLVSYTGQASPINTVVGITTSWQKFTLTTPIASTVTEIAPLWAQIPTGTAGANDYFDITGVQLEIAPQATPFSRAGGSIGGELALCQRYYQQPVSTASYQIFGVGTMYSATSLTCLIPLIVQMRIAPSVTFSANSNWNIQQAGGFAVTSLSAFTVTPTAINASVNTSISLLSGGGGILISNGSGAAIYITAEL